MILRKGQIAPRHRPADEAADAGHCTRVPLSDAGGLTQFGVFLETLAPGARSSDRHWHSNQDEFLLMVEGQATLIDDDGAHPLRPGDAVGWRKGVANGHSIENRSDAPCSYVITGTRTDHDVVHYPDLGHTQYHDVPDWRVEDSSGRVLRQGKV